QNLEFYKEYKPGFFAYDVNVPKGTDSVWMYVQVHHQLLLEHHQVVSEFPIRGKDVLYRIVMGKKNYYGLGGFSIYQLHPGSNNTFTTSPIYSNSITKESFNVLLIDKNENPIVVGTSVTVILPGHKIISEPLNYFVDK